MKLRLLKLVVQPTFVADDGETLTEQQGQPFVVTPAELKTFVADFRRQFAELAAKFESQGLLDEARRAAVNTP